MQSSSSFLCTGGRYDAATPALAKLLVIKAVEDSGVGLVTATATGACLDARRGGGERAVGPGTSRSFASTEKSDPGGVGGDRLRKLGSFCEVVMGSPMGVEGTE